MSPGGLSPTATLFIESWFGSGLQYRHDFLATLLSVRNLEIQIGVDCPDAYASCGLLAHRNRHESRLREHLQSLQQWDAASKAVTKLHNLRLTNACQIIMRAKQYSHNKNTNMYDKLASYLEDRHDTVRILWQQYQQ
jgi:hypothetical protein